jgi:hypothetical protein
MIDFFSDLRDYLGGALGAALPSVLVVFVLLYPCCMFVGFFKKRVVKEAFWIIPISWMISVFLNTILFNGSPEPLSDGVFSMFYAPMIAIPVSIWIRIRMQPTDPS